MPSVLFVCLGNICRSPLAEGMMAHLAANAGLDVRIDSAGTGDWHVGSMPDERAIAAAARAGFDISGQRARQVSAEDFRIFDYVIAMDSDNLRNLERIRPADASARLSLLLDHAKGHAGKSVPDPYYGLKRDFDETVRLVRLGCEGLIAQLLAAQLKA